MEAGRSGLDGVVVAETRLSQVDGAHGRLVVRGHGLEALAGRVGFEEAVLLLGSGQLPTPEQAAGARRALGAARLQAFAALPTLEEALAGDDALASLRAALARLPFPEGPGPARWGLLGAAGLLAAAWARHAAGRPTPAPDPEAGHAADLLRILGDEPPAPARVEAFDTYLVTVMEHGMNASTFTARVVASTRADALSVVLAALGALKGPLHGGAPGPVLDMLDAVGRPEHARSWLEAELAAGRRIMGLGHRIYRVRDPRAAVLERALETLERAGHASRYLDLARSVEQAAVGLLAERHPLRRLGTNVEFYTAVLLDAVGLPRALFTPVFAASRIAGWLAHAEEQQAGGRLLRPSQRYLGPLPTDAATTPAVAGGQVSVETGG